MVPRMSYVLSVKALPGGPQAAPTAVPAGQAPPAPDDPNADVQQWAGDLYEEGDETTPEAAYASFTAPNGDTAWLDRSEDGTLTGWVRAGDGTVYRYSDPDAWALDVDGSQQMVKQSGPATPADGMDPAADPNADPAADPMADEPLDDEALDGEVTDEDLDAALDAEGDEQLDDEADAADLRDDEDMGDPGPEDLGAGAAADDPEADPFADDEDLTDDELDPADEDLDDEDLADDEDPADDDEEDDEDPFAPKGAKKKGGKRPPFEKKSLAGSFRVGSGARIVVRPR